MGLQTAQIQDTKEVNLLHKFMFDNYVPPILFQGVTEDATPTEIFIDNQPNWRLEIPKNSVIYARWVGAAFNITDGVGTAHGNVVATEGTFSARRADTAFVLIGGATGTGFVFTADDTIDAMKCTVTGTAAKRIIWKAELKVIVAHGDDVGNIANGIYTGTNY